MSTKWKTIICFQQIVIKWTEAFCYDNSFTLSYMYLWKKHCPFLWYFQLYICSKKDPPPFFYNLSLGFYVKPKKNEIYMPLIISMWLRFPRLANQNFRRHGHIQRAAPGRRCRGTHLSKGIRKCGNFAHLRGNNE